VPPPRLLRLLLPVLALACAATAVPAPPPAGVEPAIDGLLRDSLHLVRGRRIGLVSNHTGVDARGVQNVDRLRAAGLDVVALFSPEHGFRGTAAPGEQVASSVDAVTGLPIYSLYGRRVTPTDSMLAGLDVLVVDLQDAGARYYTYVSTTIEVMRAAARRRLPVVVLDRPNPVGGAVQGNVLDPAARSFVGPLAVPMRHGLTIGELARLARAELGLDVALAVVPLRGWSPRQYWDETGLPFVAPSPNLRSVEALVHYGGTCLFEGTNLSVGRGSDAPFTQVGAPWLDAAAVIAAVAPALRGVRLEPVRFTPRSPGDAKFADTTVAGIRLVVTDRAAYDAPATAVRLLAAIRARHGAEFRWLAAHFDRLAGGPALRAALDAGEDPAAIVAGWAPALDAFRPRAAAVHLYPR